MACFTGYCFDSLRFQFDSVTMITKIWTSLSNIGIHEEGSVEQIKSITFINQYLVIALLIYLINVLSDSLLGYYKQSFILVSSAAVVGVFLFLNKKDTTVSPS